MPSIKVVLPCPLRPATRLTPFSKPIVTPVDRRAGFFLTAAYAGEMARNAVGGAQEKVARTDGLVANIETQQGGYLFLRGLRLSQPLGNDGFEGRVEQALDEGIGRVIAAASLA